MVPEHFTGGAGPEPVCAWSFRSPPSMGTSRLPTFAYLVNGQLNL